MRSILYIFIFVISSTYHASGELSINDVKHSSERLFSCKKLPLSFLDQRATELDDDSDKHFKFNGSTCVVNYSFNLLLGNQYKNVSIDKRNLLNQYLDLPPPSLL